ncbi:MAG TPA: transcriptional regulator GcvA [Steroidobacter sp.]|uniref:transcriptional regulator GcvA n=1 Tax=Steroidobacter sp. TaxID=1978227 RepID=UPI002EDA2BBD
MRRLPPLSALRAFEAAARHNSFKRAATELAVTPTAISHQIRSLEEFTGLTLFKRDTRKVVLTDAGARLYPVLRDGFDAFEKTLDGLVQAPSRTQVTISATNAFTAHWLVPRMQRFYGLHPEIDLHLHASDEVVDLVDDRVDIAIRYGSGPYANVSAEVLFADRFAPVVHPRLNVTTPADLNTVTLIHFQWKKAHPLNPTWERWFAEAKQRWSASAAQVRFSDEGHAIQAAVAGQGIALLSLPLVEREIAAGHLIQPFGPIVGGHTYHLVMRADRAPSPRVSAVADWLRAEARSSR